MSEDSKKCCQAVGLNWRAPAKGSYSTGLKVNNSMVGGKVEFVARNGGKQVSWYGCGPTVYDSAHMGHARNYLTFDILRRIMEDYFGYEVTLVMNVTDIDDKIIARAVESGVEFAQLARFWENEFWRNMKSLGIKLPDVITRVSEYVPEIIAFIEGIMANGYAYESGGSVYFDTSAFRGASSPEHVYGRMEPWSVNDEARVLEGEGALGVVTEKRSPLDFALWKKAKENEPAWPSPWGAGRPGWHIECSCMASNILGFPIDIHSGGIDLRFPHHDNELAQTEACFNQPQWVNYFLHSGHLHIQGLKMSKSLKNFITISAILENYDPRIVRLLVLLHRWDQPMNYNPSGESMKEPAELHRFISNFFATVKQVLRKRARLYDDWESVQDVVLPENVPEGCRPVVDTASVNSSKTVCEGIANVQKWNERDRQLSAAIAASQEKVHDALCDNFDTPTAMLSLQDLISAVNVYLAGPADELKGPLLLKAAGYVHRILGVFGLVSAHDNIFAYVDSGAGGSTEQEQMMSALVDSLAEFRKHVRETSRGLLKTAALPWAEGVKPVAVDLLKTCDEIRDTHLPRLGIRLEDQGEKGYMWKQL